MRRGREITSGCSEGQNHFQALPLLCPLRHDAETSRDQNEIELFQVMQSSKDPLTCCDAV